ncbi:MAG: hypothetical protein SOR57_12480 [Parabacteroides sp.]|nr:hypothetical protein [Parabacteroides sp.]
MKKLAFLSVMMFTAMASANLFAVENVIPTDSCSIVTIQQEDFTKIEIKDLPAAVTGAVTEKFTESEITEAFVKETEEGKIYKVTVKTVDSGEIVVIVNENGEFAEE